MTQKKRLLFKEKGFSGYVTLVMVADCCVWIHSSAFICIHARLAREACRVSYWIQMNTLIHSSAFICIHYTRVLGEGGLPCVVVNTDEYLIYARVHSCVFNTHATLERIHMYSLHTRAWRGERAVFPLSQYCTLPVSLRILDIEMCLYIWFTCIW